MLMCMYKHRGDNLVLSDSSDQSFFKSHSSLLVTSYCALLSCGYCSSRKVGQGEERVGSVLKRSRREDEQYRQLKQDSFLLGMIVWWYRRKSLVHC